MPLEPVLIGGSWRQTMKPSGHFSPVNPATGKAIGARYPVSGFADVEHALEASRKAVQGLRTASPDSIAGFFDAFASLIEERSSDLVRAASLETALPEESRLQSVELPRTVGQLRQAAEACRERTWRRAAIDTKNGIRSLHGPLGGPVVVFGPNNFPFAFNPAAGGDFAAAIAAGNPVIAKANPGHPATTKILAELALEALGECGLPLESVQLIYHLRPEDGLRLVAHPLVGATAFTGSRRAGLRLKKAADRAGKPIYLEMSSLNPVFILPGALEERPERIAEELYLSCSLGAGQFCTKPGLVVLLKDSPNEAFLKKAEGCFSEPSSGYLLNRQIFQGLKQTLDCLKKKGAEVVTGGVALKGPGYRFANSLLKVTGKKFLKHSRAFQAEVFGTFSLLVICEDFETLKEVAERLEGTLTASVYSHSRNKDDDLYAELEPIIRTKAGRLLNDKMPTGVAVSPAMNHGGPYPATGHPGFTAVGIPASILRFTALHCYDHVREDRLPPELRDRNPTGRMWRLVNGEWTQGDV